MSYTLINSAALHCILELVYCVHFLLEAIHLQDTWRQHVTGGKLREITEEAKSFAVGNKSLAALFVHTPAGELQRQIRSWLAENFEFLSVTGDDALGGTAGQLELLSTAIMDGWMAGLGAALPPNTDALGQLLSEYTKRVYTSQLQHLKVTNGYCVGFLERICCNYHYRFIFVYYFSCLLLLVY